MSFDNSVIEQLKSYVYRLVDPRNGNTFYIGKGKGNRVFNHIERRIPEDEYDQASDKYNIIKEIKSYSLDLIHIIHRHGMSDDTALEVESALIDAYTGLSNLILGHGSGDYGVMSTEQLIQLYSLEEADFGEDKLIIVPVQNTIEERSIYDAARFAWKVDINRARQADYVLASDKGKIVGVYGEISWLPATIQNFPFAISNMNNRFGFTGDEATESIQNKYLNKKVPKDYRSYGTIRYVNL